MRKTLLSLLLLVAPLSPAMADMAFMGAGSSKCSEYLDGVKRFGNDIRDLYFQWAQGYMSGLNTPLVLKGGGQSTDLAAYDTDKQSNALHRFCQDNPDKSYVQGVILLFDVMRDEQKLPDWREGQQGQQSQQKGLGR